MTQENSSYSKENVGIMMRILLLSRCPLPYEFVFKVVGQNKTRVGQGATLTLPSSACGSIKNV